MMKISQEINALHNMCMFNGGDGEISPFIYCIGKTVFIDVYSLIVSVTGRDAIRKQYLWESNPDVVDLWDDMKCCVEITDRRSYRETLSVIRWLAGRLRRKQSVTGIVAACALHLRMDVRFLFESKGKQVWHR